MPWPNLAHHVTVWRAAWAARHEGVSSLVPNAREAEFLPAVLEIQDRPVSPVGRAIGMTLVVVVVTGIVWATVGQIDIVAVAQGKIVPGGHSKIVQPLGSGVIRAIHVRDGQVVKTGEVLIELDPTVTGAEHERVLNEHRVAVVEAARLRALIAEHTQFPSPEGADPAFVALQHRFLQQQLAEFQVRVGAAKQVIKQREAAVKATQATIHQLNTTVPIQAQKAAAYKKLVEQGFVAELEYLAAEKERVEGVQELAKQQELLGQNQAALAEAQSTYRAMTADFQQTHQAELSDKDTKVTSLSKELVKASQQVGFQTLTSPIDGVVQQLAVFTVGGVVTPAQQLMVVVPLEHQLEVEARVGNQDIGFVQAGQPVQVKVDTFLFTRYGIIDGRVVGISNDAIQLEKGDLIYTARVSLDRSTMMVDGKKVNLTPGMAVTVEIKTGQRQLIEYFLSPLLKYKQESLRER